MRELRALRYRLQEMQDREDKRAGRHVNIPITANLLIDIINAEEMVERGD